MLKYQPELGLLADTDNVNAVEESEDEYNVVVDPRIGNTLWYNIGFFINCD